MQQQFARPRRRVIGAAGLCVLGDVSVDQIKFAALLRRVEFPMLLCRAERLHFGVGQRNAGFNRIPIS
jgi:hypothetical protein